MAEKVADVVLEIRPVDGIDLCGDLERDPGAPRNFNGAVRPLFRADAPKKSQIAAVWRSREGIDMHGQAMMHHSDPVDRRHWQPLMPCDRDQRNVTELFIERLQIRQVQASVKCGYHALGNITEYGEMYVVDVKMQHIEVAGLAPHFFEHHDIMRRRILHAGIQPKGFFGAGNKGGGSLGISARKQRHIVALADQFFRQVGNNAFRPSIEFRRNALGQRCNLCDSHLVSSFFSVCSFCKAPSCASHT